MSEKSEDSIEKVDLNLDENKNYKIQVSPRSMKWWVAIAISLLIMAYGSGSWITSLQGSVQDLQERLSKMEGHTEENAGTLYVSEKEVERAANDFIARVMKSSIIKLECDSLDVRLMELKRIKDIKSCPEQ